MQVVVNRVLIVINENEFNLGGVVFKVKFFEKYEVYRNFFIMKIFVCWVEVFFVIIYF